MKRLENGRIEVAPLVNDLLMGKLSFKMSRDNAIGCSGKFWIFENGEKKFMFKHCTEETDENEVFINLLCDELGIECAKYHPAVVNFTNDKPFFGVITENFLKKGEKEVSFLELAFKSSKESVVHNFNKKENYVSNIVSTLEKTFDLSFNIDQIENQLIQMSLFDFITGQMDRHPQNISFIIDENNNLRLSPLFDSAFLASHTSNTQTSCSCVKLGIVAPVSTLDDFILQMSNQPFLTLAKQLCEKVSKINIPLLLKKYEIKTGFTFSNKFNQRIACVMHQRLEIIQNLHCKKNLNQHAAVPSLQR